MIKITCVCENTVYHKKCWAEEGLSIFIESGTPHPVRILYDCGRSGTVLTHNLKNLGIEPGSIDYLILSHGHSGHIGGLEKASDRFTETCVVLHPNIFVQKLKKRSTELELAGDQPRLNELLAQNIKRISKEPINISDSIVVSGEIPLTKKIYDGKERYFIKSGKNVKPDLFEEELAIGIKINEAVLIITSCSHRGIMNIVKHMTSLFNDAPLYGIIGGLHLRDDLVLTGRVVKELKNPGLNLIAPCHCTGILAESMIYDEFPDQYHRFHTGDTITL